MLRGRNMRPSLQTLCFTPVCYLHCYLCKIGVLRRMKVLIKLRSDYCSNGYTSIEQGGWYILKRTRTKMLNWLLASKGLTVRWSWTQHPDTRPPPFHVLEDHGHPNNLCVEYVYMQLLMHYNHHHLEIVRQISHINHMVWFHVTFFWSESAMKAHIYLHDFSSSNWELKSPRSARDAAQPYI